MIYSYNKNQRNPLFLKFIFGIELYMFQTGLLSIIRSLSTVYTAIGICHTGYADCLVARSGSILISLASSQHNLYDKYLFLCIQYWTSDDGQ